MKPSILKFSRNASSSFLAFLLALPVCSGAQDALIAPPRSKSRVTISSHLGFNIKARFNDTTPLRSIPSAGLSGQNREYDDGFVRVDSSGNALGRTWYWGYQDAAQVPGDDTIRFHSATAPAGGRTGAFSDDPQPGFEVTYSREFAFPGRVRLSFEGAFGFTDLSLRHKQSIRGPLTLLTDTYALGGLIPPFDPYTGDFTGPGASIPDTGTRTITTTSGTISGERSITGSLFLFRFGPNVDFDLGKRFSISLGAGPALAVIDGGFRFDETVQIAGVPNRRFRGEDSKLELTAGVYASAKINYYINNAWDLFVGLQYQTLDNMVQQAKNRQGELDLRNSLFLSTGVGFHF